MKKANRSRSHEEPSVASLADFPEVDFSKLQRIPNPYIGRTFANVRILAPDVEAAFPDSEAVNQALRVVMALRDVVQAKPAPAPRRTAKTRSVKKQSSRAA